MLFHKNDCNKFVTLGRKFDTKTFELVTEFFQAQFMTNKNDGTLKHMELKCIKKRAQFKLKNKLCNKICACEAECCSYRAKRKIASCDTQCHLHNDCKEQH
jgi:hypothetical protein